MSTEYSDSINFKSPTLMKNTFRKATPTTVKIEEIATQLHSIIYGTNKYQWQDVRKNLISLRKLLKVQEYRDIDSMISFCDRLLEKYSDVEIADSVVRVMQTALWEIKAIVNGHDEKSAAPYSNSIKRKFRIALGLAQDPTQHNAWMIENIFKSIDPDKCLNPDLMPELLMLLDIVASCPNIRCQHVWDKITEILEHFNMCGI